MARVQFSRRVEVYETIVVEVPDEWVDDDYKMESVGYLVDSAPDGVWDTVDDDSEDPQYEGEVDDDPVVRIDSIIRDASNMLDYGASVTYLERSRSDDTDDEDEGDEDEGDED